MVFLLINSQGGILDIVSGDSYDSVYAETIAKNHGEILVEVSEEVIKEILRKEG